MSGGDRNDPVPFTSEEACNVVKFSLVETAMRWGYTIYSNFDIPYVSGHSHDASTVYISRGLGTWFYKGNPRPVTPFLCLHEHVEKSILAALGKAEGRELERMLTLLRLTGASDAYPHVHGVATAVEEYAVRMQFGEPGVQAYNAFIHGEIMSAEDGRIRRVPADLDMTGYRDVHLRLVTQSRMIP